jgi:hypothetical protein
LFGRHPVLPQAIQADADKWASSLVATSWYRGSISFLLLLPELSMLEIV